MAALATLHPGIARERAADATGLIRRLADHAQTIPAQAHAGTLATLAGQACAAAQAVDACLGSASQSAREPADAATAHAALELARRWIALLSALVDTAVAIYAEACTELADRVALAEEHDLIPAADGGIGAARLAAATRPLGRG
jgi:hypothetical protein